MITQEDREDMAQDFEGACDNLEISIMGLDDLGVISDTEAYELQAWLDNLKEHGGNYIRGDA